MSAKYKGLNKKKKYPGLNLAENPPFSVKVYDELKWPDKIPATLMTKKDKNKT
jgi:hypothetical protein